MGRIINKLHHEKDAQVQRNTQAGNSITNIKVKIDFTLPALSATNVVRWTCHLDDSAKVRYDMILGWDLLTEVGLNIKISEHVIEADDGPFNRSITTMVDLGNYILKYLNTRKITPK